MLAPTLLLLVLGTGTFPDTFDAPARSSEQEEAASPLTAGSLKEDVDLSLRALRRLQDPSTGSYGNSVRVTQAALTAFATSHRTYRATEGPFLDRAVDWLVGQQREDGSWLDADATGGDPERVAKLRTMGVVGVLDLLGDPDTRAARARGRAYLGVDDSVDLRPDPLADGGADERPLDVLLAEAAGLLASRNPDGSWGEGDARVEATAHNALELSGLHRMVQARERASAGSVEHKPLPPFSGADREKARKAMERGAAFLVEHRNDDGLWGSGGRTDAGITAMVVAALQAATEPWDAATRAAVDHGLDYLRGLRHGNGAIHAGQLFNYVTSAAVMALSRAGAEEDRQLLADARAYLRDLQADEGEGYGPADRYYGGVGYGGDERPDLSNLNFALEALATGPAGENEASFRKALVFLQRCQNYSEANDLVLEVGDGRVESGTDGGATYAPGESKAGYVELGEGVKVPRSYGSMSYALLRGYLFAGLSRDDPRVEVLWKWLQRNYTLDINPGFESTSDPTAAYQGLFYYFFTMARALEVYGTETLVDALGNEHPWRAELSGRLVAMQRQDGSWVNENSSRWYEGNPVLATAYAMVTLGEALPE